MVQLQIVKTGILRQVTDGSTYKYFDFHIEVQHHSGTQSGVGELRFQQSGSNIGSSTTSNGVK